MSKDDIQKDRILAIQRFINGEKAQSICSSLCKSGSWLYKWLSRYRSGNPLWFQNISKRPYKSPNCVGHEIEEIVKIVRLSLYNKDLFCGAQAIHWELEDLNVKPIPSLRTINRILSRHGLTHRRTGHYEPKGVPYPNLKADMANETHQADLVGPRHLKGPIRFYSLNVIDLNTGRCGVQPIFSRSGQSIIDGFWAIWKRLGIPINVQIDNDMAFYGSPTHPRGMGPLIRLCLHNKVEPWFIPISEPWRNGVVEKFNDHYQQKFLSKINMATEEELLEASMDFEYKHNSSYRYTKLGGQSPLKALANMKKKLRFPKQDKPPKHRMEKPKTGRYHLVRFIRGNLRLNIFGEHFPLHPDLQYEYVVATIDVKEQRLKIFLDNAQVDDFNYDSL